MDLQLTNKVALVTAASGGLGQATAMQLLAEGAKVAVCGRSKKRLDKAYANVLRQTDQPLAVFDSRYFQ